MADIIFYLAGILHKIYGTGKTCETVFFGGLRAVLFVYISANAFVYGRVLGWEIIVVFVVGIIHAQASVFQRKCGLRLAVRSGDNPWLWAVIQ